MVEQAEQKEGHTDLFYCEVFFTADGICVAV